LDELKLYCQNCCARYDYCIYKDSILPYDKSAETCPDFLPKDIYKAIRPGTENINVNMSKTPCYWKRKLIEPDFRPLPADVPLSFWTKQQLERAKKYALKRIEEEKKMEKN